MSDKKVTTKCKVCNEPAAGYHFGAFTCEGCKSFFGRTYTNRNNIQPCKNGGKCVINKNTRTACKHCRLAKCEKVGMSKSGSRYGRRSNWFKIAHFLEGQREQANQNDPEAPSTSGLNNRSLSNGVLTEDARDIPSTSQENPAMERPLRAALLRETNGLGRHLENMSPQDRYSINRPLTREDYLLFNIEPPTEVVAPSKPKSSDNRQERPRRSPERLSGLFAPLEIPTYTPHTIRWNLESISRHRLNGLNGSDRNSSNGEDRLHDVECRSNSSRTSSSRTSERESPNIRIPASRIYIPADNSPSPILLCSPPGMTSVTAHSARGGDLLLASPNPGGLADSYEPIDLSTRASGSSSRSRGSLEENNKEKKGQKNNRDSSTEETTADPLDLTLPAGASLTRR